MSERIGAVKLGEDNGEPFLGRDFGHTRNYSEEIAAIIDEEISSLMTNAHQEAFDILVRNRPVLDSLVTQLLEKETIDRAGLEPIFNEVAMSQPRPAWTGSDNRVPSELPPVEVPAHVASRPEPHGEITVGPGGESNSGSALPPMAPPTGPPATGPLPPYRGAANDERPG
jgi:cell division protease FtsH